MLTHSFLPLSFPLPPFGRLLSRLARLLPTPSTRRNHPSYPLWLNRRSPLLPRNTPSFPPPNAPLPLPIFPPSLAFRLPLAKKAAASSPSTTTTATSLPLPPKSTPPRLRTRPKTPPPSPPMQLDSQSTTLALFTTSSAFSTTTSATPNPRTRPPSTAPTRKRRPRRQLRRLQRPTLAGCLERVLSTRAVASEGAWRIRLLRRERPSRREQPGSQLEEARLRSLAA
jgi:hypothetical protein